jgi:hypothetical protein
MNLTLLAAVAMLLAWLVLVFIVHAATGYVHLLYAGAVILFARRVLVGAPSFRS